MNGPAAIGIVLGFALVNALSTPSSSSRRYIYIYRFYWVVFGKRSPYLLLFRSQQR